jgi:hypothetical protein
MCNEINNKLACGRGQCAISIMNVVLTEIFHFLSLTHNTYGDAKKHIQKMIILFLLILTTCVIHWRGESTTTIAPISKYLRTSEEIVLLVFAVRSIKAQKVHFARIMHIWWSVQCTKIKMQSFVYNISEMTILSQHNFNPLYALTHLKGMFTLYEIWRSHGSDVCLVGCNTISTDNPEDQYRRVPLTR